MRTDIRHPDMAIPRWQPSEWKTEIRGTMPLPVLTRRPRRRRLSLLVHWPSVIEGLGAVAGMAALAWVLWQYGGSL